MTIPQDDLASQDDLVKQLLVSPGCFAHEARDIEHIETHISHLLLVGDYVYKIKKPLNLGFLDFSTLEKRRLCCEAELRLNRRLAPELYLELIAIRGTPRQPTLSGQDEVIEYAVKMRRFQQRALLSRTLPNRAELSELARQIAAFHRQIPAASAASAWGTPAAVRQPMEENFRHIRELKHPLLESERLVSLRNWSESFLSDAEALLQERREAGMIRECHGDLHLGNITRFEGRLLPFDGIEFNPALRWIDVLSDLAFLLMDLQYRERGPCAAQLLNDYLAHTGDYAGLPLLPFYLLYRALVRAKVCAIRFTQPHIGRDEAAELLDEYRRYLNLAESVTGHPPAVLVITHGVSGSGKSHIGGWLAERLMAIRIRSDVERRRLFPETDAEAPARRYGERATQTVYAHLRGIARRLLLADYAVVVDATFLRREHRASFIGLARELDTPFLILDCRASQAVLCERIAARAAAGEDPSQADLEVLRRQQSTAEPLSEAELRHALAIDSEGFPPAGMLATILQRLMGQGLAQDLVG